MVKEKKSAEKINVTASELEELQGMIKTLSSKLNKFKIDNQSLHKLLEEREQKRYDERRQNMVKNYRFTEDEMDNFITEVINVRYFDDELEKYEDDGVCDYTSGNWMMDNLDSSEIIQMRSSIAHCLDELRAVLIPKLQPELPNKKRVRHTRNSFRLPRRARSNIQLGSDTESEC